MAITIRSPKFSFVRFEEEEYETCYSAGVQFNLPVAAFDDVAFQFVITCDTAAQANELLNLANDKVAVGLIAGDDECGDPFVVNFLTLGYKPERYKLAEKQILFNWEHGFPQFDTHFAVGKCFKIKIVASFSSGDISACSNQFERVTEDCYTSVLEYGSEQNIFDFNYCGSGAMFEEPTVEEDCEPTIYNFNNVPTIAFPYTADMLTKYGTVPTVEIWFYDPDNNDYYKPIIRVGFDAYPPTVITADLGGNATGYMKIY